jgi:ABC-type transport system involved in multi-copper enzyme maturation permease subunit
VRRVLAVGANTFRETVRERVLYNLVFFALLMTLSGLLLRDLTIRQDDKIIKDLGLAVMDLFGTLISIFLGVGLVSKEIERRSLYPLLAKPLSRGELFVGKFGGLAFTLLVNTAVMTMGVYLALLLAGRPLAASLLKAVYPLYLSFLLVVALALLFSSFTSATLASVATVGLVVAGRFADVVRNMREVLPGTPSWLSGALYYALPNFTNFDFKSRVAYGDPVSGATLAWVTLYGAAYTAALLGVGLALFRRRDFN